MEFYLLSVKYTLGHCALETFRTELFEVGAESIKNRTLLFRHKFCTKLKRKSTNVL